MGNETSSEKSSEQLAVDAAERDQIRREVIADLDRRKEAAKRRIAERKQAKLMTAEYLVQLNVADDALQPSQEHGEIIETPGPSSEDVLKDFQPRKEPRERPLGYEFATVKRRAPSPHANLDPRRSSMSEIPKIPKIPKRTARPSDGTGAKTTSSTTAQSTMSNQSQPRWYRELVVKNSRSKGNSQTDVLLGRLHDQIRNAQNTPRGEELPRALLNRIREGLHTILFVEVNEQLLKKNRILHEEGLPSLLQDKPSESASWPFDIRADAKELYNKWSKKVFEADIMRGINFESNKADSVDEAYKVSARYHGAGDLVSGQWFPLQIAALRDGAHGEMIAGICGKPGDGAYSVVMSGGHAYADEDYGDEVLYCGTDSKDGAPTENTHRTLESVGSQQPVRLIRSHKLDSPYAPKMGFRYDGLYDVVGSEMLDDSDSARQRHRFRLLRRPGQDPIRGGPGQEAGTRPTRQEMEAYKKHRRFIGKDKAC